MSGQQTLTADLQLAPPLKTSFVFDIDYRKMYHNVRRCNDVVLHKLEKARRSADYWKRVHATLIDTLWGWTTTQVKIKKPLQTPYPVKAKKQKKNGAATSFTFPPEQKSKELPQTPTVASLADHASCIILKHEIHHCTCEYIYFLLRSLDHHFGSL